MTPQAGMIPLERILPLFLVLLSITIHLIFFSDETLIPTIIPYPDSLADRYRRVLATRLFEQFNNFCSSSPISKSAWHCRFESNQFSTAWSSAVLIDDYELVSRKLQVRTTSLDSFSRASSTRRQGMNPSLLIYFRSGGNSAGSPRNTKPANIAAPCYNHADSDFRVTVIFAQHE